MHCQENQGVDMHIIMFVLNEPDKLYSILDEWKKIGIEGVTITESTGTYRVQQKRKSLHMRYMLPIMDTGPESGNLTLFAIVPDGEIIQKCIEATELIVGSLDNPGTGIIVAWPLSVSKGLSKNQMGQ